MTKKKAKKSAGIPKSKIMSALRRIWLYSPQRKEAKNRNKTHDGFFRCDKCKHLVEEVAIDHEPSVVPLNGFDSYQGVIERMFCDSDKLQVLCNPCHSAKTAFEANSRKENRKIKKEVDKKKLE